MPEFMGLIAILLLFGGPVAIILYVIRQRSRERMEMINKGLNPMLYNQARVPKVGSGDLKGGMIILAIGLAMVLSATVVQRYYDRDLMTFAIIFCFIGLSLLGYWWITRKERERAQVIYEKQLQRLADQYCEDTQKTDVTL